MMNIIKILIQLILKVVFKVILKMLEKKQHHLLLKLTQIKNLNDNK